MQPFDWLGTAVRNEPQRTRWQSVAAAAVRLVAVVAIIGAAGAALALGVKVFLFGWWLAW